MDYEKAYKELVDQVNSKRNTYQKNLIDNQYLMDIQDIVRFGEANAYQRVLNKIAELDKKQ